MSKDITEEAVKSLKAKVYACARDGMAISIFAMLWNSDKTIIHEVLNHVTEENEQKTTPLIIAARNGSEKVVSILLSNFNVDIEQTGTVKFENYTIDKATALWCAAGAGHFGIIKLLIQNGADVNHPTKTNSTPLRAACFDGRLEIVKYLVQHNADISLPNTYRNTCLMIASYKGHIEVVKYLLEKKGNPNTVAHCGATALHFAAECGHVNIVKELINYRAKQIENDHKMTPLLVAAEAGKFEVVDYMVSLPSCTKKDKIDALELLGAFYANDKIEYDLNKAVQYFEEAMHVRYSDPDNIIYKEYYPPVPAYENVNECQTLEDLQKIKGQRNAIHMQALTVKERILGEDNPEVASALIYRGAVYADSARFSRCIELWFHALKLRQKNKSSVSKDLLRFAQVFSQMIHVGEKLAIAIVAQVFEKAVDELVFDSEKLKLDVENVTAKELFQINIHTSLYLLVIALHCDHSEEDLEKLKALTYKFVKLNPLLENKYTPLHMAVDSATMVDDFHVEEVVSFPNGLLTELFMQCGACPNVVDCQKNTPLHIIVRHNDPETLHPCMLSLIKNGAHIDMCNLDKKTPLECSLTDVACSIIRNNSEISLKCIAARCIQKNVVQFKDLVPDFLEEFIAMH
ncbi:FEM1B [Mytilus coruscus]|uniref:FEM1B n=1 Tax=Mytilus coruscus TaxID=42192 RepID=A0A6J8CR98_MYTCO|nr:FEM1B [Mytilus coruscus]